LKYFLQNEKFIQYQINHLLKGKKISKNLIFNIFKKFSSSFVPSADERRIVGRMVHAIKNGWMKRREEIEKEDEERELEEEFPKVFFEIFLLIKYFFKGLRYLVR